MTVELRCEDFARVGHWDARRCCTSCHPRIARGQGEIDITPLPNARGREARVRAYVCCNFMPSELLDFSRALFAKLLWARRASERGHARSNVVYLAARRLLAPAEPPPRGEPQWKRASAADT